MDSTSSTNPSRKKICLDPTIISGNSSMTAPKGSYKKPEENSFTRSFTRGPLKIPINRVQSEGEKFRPQMTTTAQKISDTLASISTPVTNVKKVQIWQNEHSKFVKPKFETGGPPKVGSPLSFSRIMPYHTPKKSLSNSQFPIQSTPLPGKSQPFPNFSLTSYELPNPQQSSGGGKILQSKRVHAQAPRINELKKAEIPKELPSDVNVAPLKMDFKFQSPWTKDDILKYMKKKASVTPSKIQKKDTKQVRSETIKPTVELNKKESNAGPKKMDFTPMLTNPLTIPTNNNGWDCPSCMVKNEESSEKCVCCTEINPKLKKDQPKTTATIVPFIPLQITKTTWDCTICMVPNKIEVERCVCCTEKNPNFKSPPPPGILKKWDCPVCMIKNDVAAIKCVCCAAINPTAPKSLNGSEKDAIEKPTFSFGFTAPPANVTTPSKAPEIKKTVSFSFTPSMEPSESEKNPSKGSSLQNSFTSSTSYSFGFDVGANKPLQGFLNLGSSPQKEGNGENKKEPSRVSFGVSPSEITIKRNAFDPKAFGFEREEPKLTDPKSTLSFSTSPSPMRKRRLGDSNDELPTKKSETAGSSFGFKSGIPDIPSFPSSISSSIFGAVQKPVEPEPSKFKFEPFFGGFGGGSTVGAVEAKPPASQFLGLTTMGGSGNSIPSVSSAPSASSASTFNFNPPSSEPTLKLKTTENVLKTEPTKINTNSLGFMQALGNSTFGAPPAATSAPAPSATPNSNIFIFGAKPNTEVPKTFNFVSAASSFSSGSTPVTTSANAPAAPFIFGQTPAAPPKPTMSMGLPAQPPAPPAFNMTPSFNFTANAMGASPNPTLPQQPTLFQFNAPPSNVVDGQRVIKRAIRRKK